MHGIGLPIEIPALLDFRSAKSCNLAAFGCGSPRITVLFPVCYGLLILQRKGRVDPPFRKFEWAAEGRAALSDRRGHLEPWWIADSVLPCTSNQGVTTRCSTMEEQSCHANEVAPHGRIGDWNKEAGLRASSRNATSSSEVEVSLLGHGLVPWLLRLRLLGAHGVRSIKRAHISGLRAHGKHQLSSSARLTIRIQISTFNSQIHTMSDKEEVKWVCLGHLHLGQRNR
ncbi:hypothetical protein BP00DRAFT_62392 [Aspergillus indologenus CBS 114.80]|uniref:Uncharacterized protein n=1 Tax=Aspergillus indologenus CBS 114.80 TaxID=1450541 RepID=A0A2V5HQ01_9EURO|nr:hypothetical protein BP00DRAFT_62392 [Aspergillus indologenus CBS 114.80]